MKFDECVHYNNNMFTDWYKERFRTRQTQSKNYKYKNSLKYKKYKRGDPKLKLSRHANVIKMYA